MYVILKHTKKTFALAWISNGEIDYVKIPTMILAEEMQCWLTMPNSFKSAIAQELPVLRERMDAALKEYDAGK